MQCHVEVRARVQVEADRSVEELDEVEVDCERGNEMQGEFPFESRAWARRELET